MYERFDSYWEKEEEGRAAQRKEGPITTRMVLSRMAASPRERFELIQFFSHSFVIKDLLVKVCHILKT